MRIVCRAAAMAWLVCALTTSGLVTSGCTGLHRVALVPASASAPPMLNPADRVRVTLGDGHRVDFTVERTDATAIVARHRGDEIRKERYVQASAPGVQRR